MAMIYTIADGALIYLAASRYVKLLKNAPDFVPAKGYLKDARVKSLSRFSLPLNATMNTISPAPLSI